MKEFIKKYGLGILASSIGFFLMLFLIWGSMKYG